MKILLIEDDESIARLEKNYLEIEGYEVILDKQGDLEVILQVIEEIELVILDLMLPNNDGFEICRHIRKRQIFLSLLCRLRIRTWMWYLD